MLAGHLAYANGRIVITAADVSGDDTNRQARMLSFAPERPRAQRAQRAREPHVLLSR